ncbi:MBL fold metallo-hydrolase [Undibacterium sp. LX40W]|uniref:MBL fold metallo-hydrolase n=2 Tax=Oxalobacteraceae TaxID=75682 RepID=A0A923HL87_9BURK|nr:MBL fold metallo-hydrolase [Undibacterium nitidum]MBC3890840.1 MBL fold metallo-hydrolase [Undibacterium sp. LX40W]
MKSRIRTTLESITKVAPRATAMVLTVGILSSLGTAPAYAGAPMVKAAAPGYYRVMLGDFEVTALSDGTVALPVDKLLTNTTPDKTLKALTKNHLTTPLQTSVNGYLINTGSKLVLIDTGAAGLFGPTLGRLANSLKAAGYTPDQVDEVYITHMHGDHVGGLMNGDQLAFPNAIIRADKHDADFWLSQANMDKAPADGKGGFQGAMASLNPYVKAGKFKTFDGDTELVPGVKAIAARGHTPGHSIYMAESKGQKLILWGDLMHVAAVQFENPEVTIGFDSDSKAAKAQRKKAYAEAAKEGYMVGATHLSFPGLGYIRAEGKGYVWVPVNYVPVQ